VTGSSSTPQAGTKTRLTTSVSRPRAVTITIRSIAASRFMSGAQARTIASSSISTIAVASAPEQDWNTGRGRHSEHFDQLGVRLLPHQRDRQVERVAPALPPHRQHAGLARAEADLVPSDQHMAAGERRVAAQGDFGGRREPPQLVIRLRAVQRTVNAVSLRLFSIAIACRRRPGATRRAASPRRIAGERAVGKCVHLDDPQFHQSLTPPAASIPSA
jgi:hypothetical protein